MKTIKAFVERGNDGNYSVYVDLDDNTLNYGIHGTGATVKDAIDDFFSAYEAMRKYFNEEGKTFIEAKFNIKYDMASFLSYYSNFMSLSGLEKITGVNQGQLSHYLNGYRNPSKRTIEKIEKNLHAFAKDLSQVHFV
ncbi:hypothetical protein M2138_000948 [Dysgonomonadaceae bacterium PH5-43]|nr:hypothetical protein [Dysgonomonadaceae bacterium PH5-43]